MVGKEDGWNSIAVFWIEYGGSGTLNKLQVVEARRILRFAHCAISTRGDIEPSLCGQVIT